MTDVNHLSEENSPYLQQHSQQPVHWHSWNEDTIYKAKQENKPILLSIGYAACHWCHVMSHESFEDNETAQLMNQFFINIKVDKEERPDLDKIFQTAHYYLNQTQGGWPLTLFLSPDDLTPFFSGTYFPKETRSNLPAFKDVLRTIAEAYKNNAQDIQRQNARLRQILQEPTPLKENGPFSEQPFITAQVFLENQFDAEFGGFGSAPKFPHPPILEWLLKNRSPMVEFSLRHMAESGLYDQLEGGFFRYTVDRKWEIPHFEKMLYDNAQLIYLYALASQTFDEPYFATIASETANWAIENMQSLPGGYYSSLDADSEGIEGKYYIWNKFEIAENLTTQEALFAENYFNLNGEPNFEKFWHLHLVTSLSEVTQKFNLSEQDATELLKSIKEKLLQVREKRVPPFQDQKILTAWNGLMIKALFVAGDILKENRLFDSAKKALHFIQEHLFFNGSLLACYMNGKAYMPAFLDDYAFLLDAVVTSLQIDWQTENLNFAIQLADKLLEDFQDPTGGFFFTAKDQTIILYRPKTMMDDAIPSGNAIAAKALMTLGKLIGNTTYTDAAEKTLKASWPLLVRFPSEHCNLLLVLDEYLKPSPMILLRGPVNEMATWRTGLLELNKPLKVFAISEAPENLIPQLAQLPSDGKVYAVVCLKKQCLPPMTNLLKVIEALTTL